MKKIIIPKYQYYILILPVAHVFISVIAAINYTICKNVKKSIKILLIGFLTSIIFFLLVPNFLLSIIFPDILESSFIIIYYYIVSTIVGIYFIKDQQKFLIIK